VSCFEPPCLLTGASGYRFQRPGQAWTAPYSRLFEGSSPIPKSNKDLRRVPWLQVGNNALFQDPSNPRVPQHPRADPRPPPSWGRRDRLKERFGPRTARRSNETAQRSGSFMIGAQDWPVFHAPLISPGLSHAGSPCAPCARLIAVSAEVALQ